MSRLLIENNLLMMEFDFDKNNDININTVTEKSKKRYGGSV